MLSCEGNVDIGLAVVHEKLCHEYFDWSRKFVIIHTRITWLL